MFVGALVLQHYLVDNASAEWMLDVRNNLNLTS
jgi:hypothetical protein